MTRIRNLRCPAAGPPRLGALRNSFGRGSFVACLALLGVVVAIPRAEAQLGSPHLSLDRFQPTPGSGRILAVPTSATMPVWGFTIDLAVDYARGPLGVAHSGDLIAHQVTGQIMAAIGFGRLDVGVALPATLWQQAGSRAGSLLPGPVASSSLGDLRLNVKVRLTPAEWRGGLALEALASFPTGDGVRLSGEDGFGLGGRLIGDVKLGSRVQLAGYFGYRYRTTPAQLWSLYVADELIAGLGLSVNILPKRLWIYLNGYGDFGFRSHSEKNAAGVNVTHNPDAANRPLEALVGLQVRTPAGVVISVAGGPGIGTDTGSGSTSGYGSPELRVLAMLSFESEELDRDHDGIPDLRDRCPSQAGPASNKGCPETPPVAEVQPPPPPPPPPAAPAPRRAVAVAPVDKAAEDDEGDDQAAAAPPPVAEAHRRAAKPRSAAETDLSGPNGPLAAHIFFRLGRAKIDSQQLPALDLIARTLRDHPEIARIVIEGHADEVGRPTYNYRLSLRRAEEVQRYLASHGIDSHRLAVRGFGSDKPIVEKTGSPEERAINRRVEFRIVVAGDSPNP